MVYLDMFTKSCMKQKSSRYLIPGLQNEAESESKCSFLLIKLHTMQIEGSHFMYTFSLSIGYQSILDVIIKILLIFFKCKKTDENGQILSILYCLTCNLYVLRVIVHSEREKKRLLHKRCICVMNQSWSLYEKRYCDIYFYLRSKSYMY